MSNQEKSKTVVVAMSGGVDSSVAAALLLEQGYNVIGVTMKLFNFDEVGGNIHRESSCCGVDAFNDARMVAVKLSIPHYILDFSEEFNREVIDNFIDEYKNGRTPNPCIVCNREIKWGKLLDKLYTFGAHYIATGHYARLQYSEELDRYCILRSRDDEKDQTYALWGLSQEALSRTIFPLGDLSKAEVRRIAAKYGLITATKEESFEICFVADNDYRRFLKEKFKKQDIEIKEGNLILDGKVVGEHSGIPFYTIGQRSGIGAHGQKVYVTKFDIQENIVNIGRNEDLLHSNLIAKDINFVSIKEVEDGMKVQAMIRYNDKPGSARVFNYSVGKINIVFNQPKRAITPGQSVVMYNDDKLVGGGIIEKFFD